MKRALHLALVFAFPSLVGCGKPKQADAPLRPEQVTQFDALFRQNCQGCHGVGGSKGAAPPLDDPIFLAIVPPDTVRHVVTNGRKGTLMPAFSRGAGGNLTDAQVETLAAGVLDWKRKYAGEKDEELPAYAADLPSSPTPDVKAGAVVFARTCATCHKVEEGGRDFRVDTPEFLGLVSDQLLRRIVITGRPDLGTMPSYREHASGKPITAQEIADVTAYLSSRRQPRASAQSN